MFIKQIIIQGFKSYKDQTVIEPFSPGTNVVVGRNGSGKSNFFAAIRFALGDAYTAMGREERQALLHEGSGSAVMNAYVEVIFDNSDDRFVTGTKEVSLRRTIGLKKDEYSVDKKVVTKNEVMNLLAAAGFSRSNPYYIVPQGRVTALTNMKEPERLNLLKDVAGTHEYEAKRTQSLKIMADTNNKREKIDALLDHIKERLSELEEEKDELRGFQDKDRERRCLEYAYYHKEQVAVQEALDELEELRLGGVEETDANREAYSAGEKVIAQLDVEIHKLRQRMELLGIDRRQLDDDRRGSAKARANAELVVKKLSDGMSAQEQAKEQYNAQLDKVRTAIAAREAELSKLTPEYQRRRAKEAGIRAALDSAEANLQRIFTKQSRGSQFRNKSERDSFLKKEIDDLNMTLGQQKANRLDAEEEVASIKNSISQLEKDIAALRAKNEELPSSRLTLADEVSTAKDGMDRLYDEKRMLRREEEKLGSIQANAQSERDRAERELSHAMDGPTSRGLATIRRLKREREIPGAFGTLAELLSVSEAYRVPAEQVAGASLFHYVVDNERTGSYLMEELQKQFGGRVTFMPLSRLRVKQANLPRANDAIPLISKIEYDAAYEKAFQQVFGNTIICPNLTVASQYARSHNVDGITLEGDKTNKRGVMTGGFIDPRKSRLEAVRAVNHWAEECERLASQGSDITRQIEQKEQEITRASGELRKLEQKLRQMDDGYGSLRGDLAAKTSQISREQDRLETAMKRRDAIDKNMKDFGDNLSAHEAELLSDFKKSLSASEERDLVTFSNSVQELKKEWNDISKSRREVEERKKIVEDELRSNLRLKLDQLTSQAFEAASGGGSGGGLKEANRVLKKAQSTLAAVEKKLQENEQEMESAEASIATLEKQKAAKESEQQDIARAIHKYQKRMEKSTQKKALLTAKATDCARNIRDLGVLPEEAFGKYEKLDAQTISARLKKVNDALKKYKHVNKKAVEQYNSFTNQQDALLKRHKELDQSHDSIEQLVAHLDQVKDESIERTFKQVSKEFATIFERLVPAGHGRLVIQRKADRRRDPDESDQEPKHSVENYTGVGISVSFNSKVMDEQQRIQQLSGGQKSLCALCLIFALQASDPSPMVIFDEVDANLDAQYRTAVAALLEATSKEKGTQFICTTFRPEIIHVADKCYGVLFRNKNSSINVVSMDQALDFVEGLAPR